MRKNKKISRKSVVFEQALKDFKEIIKFVHESTEVDENIFINFASKSKTHELLLKNTMNVITECGYNKGSLIGLLDNEDFNFALIQSEPSLNSHALDKEIRK